MQPVGAVGVKIYLHVVVLFPDPGPGKAPRKGHRRGHQGFLGFGGFLEKRP